MNCLTLSSTKCSTSFPVLDFQLIVLDPPVSSWVPEALSSSAWVAGPPVAPGSPQGPAHPCVQPHSCSRPLLSAHRWRIRRVSGLSRTVSPSVRLRRPAWWQPGEGPSLSARGFCAVRVMVTGTRVPVSTASGGSRTLGGSAWLLRPSPGRPGTASCPCPRAHPWEGDLHSWRPVWALRGDPH